MIITSLRTYREKHTDGRVFVNGERFGNSLEDVGRPVGVKIAAETCIPEGTYHVKISYSPKFKRNMLILFNIEDDHSIERNGIRFTGVRAHGGHNVEHTAGCPIVAKHTDKKGNVSGSLETALFEKVAMAIAEGKKVLWVFTGDV